MLRTILVDDKAVIVEELRELLSDNGNIAVVGAYTNPLNALEALPDTKPDCAFLDIEMPDMSGIELAERLVSANPALEVVFVTAYNHYAAQAFEVNAIDYLLKPIRPERLEKTIDKVQKRGDNAPLLAPAACEIKCFGSFHVLVNGRPVKWGRSKSKEFMAYMLQNEGKWVTKYRLCEDLRPEYSPEQALAYLQMSVYTLRKNLKEAGCNQFEIKYADDRYTLRVKDAEWDARRFDEAYAVFRRTGSLEAARQAADFYRGDYLEGEDWLWADIRRQDYMYKWESLLAALDGKGFFAEGSI